MIVNVRGIGASPIGPRTSLSPLSPLAQSNIQQTAAGAAAIATASCADGRYSSPALKASCAETVQDPAAAALPPDQLFQLVQAKTQCHAYFDAAGIEADPAMIAQCASNPAAFIGVAAGSFFSRHKTPILIGGGLLAALVVWKVVF